MVVFPCVPVTTRLCRPRRKILLQHLRQRKVVELAIQHRFHLGIAARDRIADHDHVGVRRNILRAITGFSVTPRFSRKVDIGG